MENTLEGRNSVLEALRTDRQINRILLLREENPQGSIREIFDLIRRRNIPFERVDRIILDKNSITGKHQGIIAFVAPKKYCDIQDIIDETKKSNALIVILDGIEDPQNLGAIVRTAECAGAHGVVISKRRAAPLTETVSRVSAGAVEHVNIARVSNISDTINKLKDEGIWVVGIESGEDKTIYDVDFKLPTAIVIGSEGSGVSRLVKERCEVLASIPMKGKISSLNAATAAAITLFEAVRQRTFS